MCIFRFSVWLHYNFYSLKLFHIHGVINSVLYTTAQHKVQYVSQISRYNDNNLDCFNSFPSSAAYMCQWSGSALVQITACRYSAPRHYLNQCWIIVYWALRNNFFYQNTKLYSQKCIEKCLLRDRSHFVQGWFKIPVAISLVCFSGSNLQ